MAIYNRLTSESALIDKLRALENRIQTVETQGTGTISFVDETDGVQTIIGELPDGSTGLDLFVGDTTPPPVASVPTVSVQPGSFVVSWDGLFVAGAIQPRDFVHVNVIGHKMNGSATVLSTPVGVLRLPTESVLVTLDVAAAGESWQFSLESQDHTGNKAAESARSISYVMKDSVSTVDAAWNDLNADIAAAQTSANSAQTTANNAQATADTAASDAASAVGIANSKGKVLTQNTAPAAADQNSNTLWIDTTNGANTPKRWDGAAWVAVTDKVAVDAANAAATAQTRADQAYNEAVSAATAAGNAQTTADGKNRVWYQTTAPAGTSHKNGDSWYDTDDGNKLYLWTGASWDAFQDTAIAAAQTTANSAQTAANGKNTNYYQDTQPTGGTYKTGDTWFDTDDNYKMYSWSGTAWQLVQDSNTALTTANSKIKTFIQGTAPTATATGDLWIDTANGNQIKRWSGSAWVDARDTTIATAQSTANTALTSANGKNKIYYQTAMPTGGTYIAGDTWFDTDDGNKVYVYNGATFVVAQDTAIATAQSTANTANSTANSALSTANSKIKTYFQTAQPGTTGNTTGDIWFDTDDGNKVYVWNGSAWAVAQDAGIAAAQTAANGKNKNYYQTAQPSGGTYLTGDLWFDTDDNYKMYTYNGSAWIVTQDSAGAIVSAEKYSQARGMDLVTNGNGQLLSNKNFSPFTYDQTDTPTGAVGVFDYPLGASLMLSDELMRVDPAKSYQLRVTAKQKTAGVITTAYTGLVPHDPMGLAISPTFYMEQANTRTTLAAALNPGATTITLTSAANWNNAGGASATHLRSMIVWNYVDGAGKLWAPGTYSRNYYGDLWNEGSISGNVITLKAPWAGPAIPAGTTVGNGSSGGTYMYVAMSNTIVPGTWTSYSGTVAGVHTDLTVSATTKFPIPTASVKLVFLGNRVSGSNPTTGSKHSFGNISFSEVSAANLEAGGITETLIGPNAVSTTKISDAAITNAKIADLAVTDAKISTLNAGKITAGVLDAARIGADTITSAHIAANAITADELAANSITAAKGQISDAAITTAKIADAQITNAKIADLAVTNAKIADATIQSAKIGSVDAGTITVGTLSADRIGANSLTAAKLAVTDFTNLVDNGRFNIGADGLSGWNTGSGTVVTDTGVPSGKALKIDGNGGYPARYQTKTVPALPGDKFRLKAWLKRSATTTNTTPINIRMLFKDLAGATVASGNIGFSVAMTSVDVWYQANGTITAPAGSVYAQIWVEANNQAPAGSSVFVSEFEAFRMNAGELIVDGTIKAGSAIIESGAIGTAHIGDTQITTAKIANLAVTDAKIFALDAGKITTGFLGAGRIQAGSITADKLLVSNATNVLLDPSFLVQEVTDARTALSTGGTAGWTIIAGTATEPKAVQRVTTTTNDIFYYNTFSSAVSNAPNAIQATAGQKWLFSVDVTTSASAGVRWNMRNWHTDGTTTFVSGTASSWNVATGRRTLSFVYTVPAGVVAFYPNLACNTSGVTWTVHGNAFVGQQAKATLIEDGAITTTHMTANTIDASVLTAGTITAPKIAAKTITTDKMVITSTDNLVIEPDFSNNGASWQLSANKTVNATAGRGSLPAYRVTGTITTETSINLVNKIPVGSEDRFRVGMWVKSTAALAAGSVKLGIRCYTTATTYTDIFAAPNDLLVANTWTNLSGIAPALPTGTIAVEFFTWVTNNATGTITDIDYVSVTRASDGKLIVDGAIDGKTITGATIQTAQSPNARVMMDSTGLHAWDSANFKYLTADSSGITLDGLVKSTGKGSWAGNPMDVIVAMGDTVQTSGNVSISSWPPPDDNLTRPGIAFVPTDGRTVNRYAGFSSEDSEELEITGGLSNLSGLNMDPGYVRLSPGKAEIGASNTTIFADTEVYMLTVRTRTWGELVVGGNTTLNGTLNGVNMDATSTSAITYQNSWTDFGAGYAPLRVKETAPGVIMIEGMPKPGTKTDGVVIGILPVQFRPTKIHNIATNIRTTLSAPNQNEAALLQVSTNGNLHLFANNIASCSYATISVTYFLNS